MLIEQIPAPQLARRLRTEGVRLTTGAFTVHLHLSGRTVVQEFARLYARYPVEQQPGIDDARIRVGPAPWYRRLGGATAHTFADEFPAVKPVPMDRAFTALETGLNWGVMRSGAAPIIMHSAVLERHGRAMLMPAPSGSGKSTLAAALALRGWRLLSDEMAVFSFEDFEVIPNPRPVSLKNKAIEVIGAFAPDAIFSRTFVGTPKGDVAYMRAPDEALARLHQRARPNLVLIPKYQAGADTTLRRLGRSEAFNWLIESTGSYPTMLDTGFGLLARLVESCGLYALEYSNLDQAIALLTRLSDDHENSDPD